MSTNIKSTIRRHLEANDSIQETIGSGRDRRKARGRSPNPSSRRRGFDPSSTSTDPKEAGWRLERLLRLSQLSS